MLEEGSFRNRSADFVMMFLFGGSLMLVSDQSSCHVVHLNPNSPSCPHPVIRDLCEPAVPGSGLYDNARVRVVEKEPPDPNELLWNL